MKKKSSKPYILNVAEIIYLAICEIKKKDNSISNLDAMERFIGSPLYEKISSGKYHDEWFEKLKKNNFIDTATGEKISAEVIRLLELQKEAMIKQLIKFPELYYAKSHFPLELSQRAINHLWRVCESYELWCNETNNNNLIKLNILD
tara:strand:- start:68 stop:508 length:441 start_codon:yes stop_codon:yes gene_type:complete